MRIFTIGFTKKKAKTFFSLLREAGVRRIVDVRLNNVSQLAGFSKRDDLGYFLRAIENIDYIHLPELAPTQELLDAFKKQQGEWKDYEERYLALIKFRRVETSKSIHDRDCLLCSEHRPDQCHRRLIAEYLQRHWKELRVQHLQ